jgi:hypothetical protein
MLGGLSACSEGTFPEAFSQRYVIEVDSLSAPTKLVAGDTLEVRFWGYVGPNSCHEFEGFEEELNPGGVELTLWTSYYRRANTGCVEMPIYLYGALYRHGPLAPGAFEIVVHQPSGELLEQTITVVEPTERR